MPKYIDRFYTMVDPETKEVSCWVDYLTSVKPDGYKGTPMQQRLKEGGVRPLYPVPVQVSAEDFTRVVEAKKAAGVYGIEDALIEIANAILQRD